MPKRERPHSSLNTTVFWKHTGEAIGVRPARLIEWVILKELPHGAVKRLVPHMACAMVTGDGEVLTLGEVGDKVSSEDVEVLLHGEVGGPAATLGRTKAGRIEGDVLYETCSTR